MAIKFAIYFLQTFSLPNFSPFKHSIPTLIFPPVFIFFPFLHGELLFPRIFLLIKSLSFSFSSKKFQGLNSHTLGDNFETFLSIPYQLQISQMVGKLGENQNAHIFATLGTFMVGALHGDLANTFFLELPGSYFKQSAILLFILY